MPPPSIRMSSDDTIWRLLSLHQRPPMVHHVTTKSPPQLRMRPIEATKCAQLLPPYQTQCHNQLNFNALKRGNKARSLVQNRFSPKRWGALSPRFVQRNLKLLYKVKEQHGFHQQALSPLFRNINFSQSRFYHCMRGFFYCGHGGPADKSPLSWTIGRLHKSPK